MNSIYLPIYLSIYNPWDSLFHFLYSFCPILSAAVWVFGNCSWCALCLRESMRSPLACSLSVFYWFDLRAISSLGPFCRTSLACCLDNLHHVSEDLCCGPGHSHQGLVGYTFNPNACEAGTERSLIRRCGIRDVSYQHWGCRSLWVQAQPGVHSYSRQRYAYNPTEKVKLKINIF